MSNNLWPWFLIMVSANAESAPPHTATSADAIIFCVMVSIAALIVWWAVR